MAGDELVLLNKRRGASSQVDLQQPRVRSGEAENRNRV